jgi:hypothetical protein
MAFTGKDCAVLRRAFQLKVWEVSQAMGVSLERIREIEHAPQVTPEVWGQHRDASYAADAERMRRGRAEGPTRACKLTEGER